MYPDNCGEGKNRQSPVDIISKSAAFVEDLDKVFVIYRNPDDQPYMIKNNGHTGKQTDNFSSVWKQNNMI